MNFFQFIKLLFHHALLVILVPLLVAGLVYYLTEGEEKTYSSTTSIYTGIASGFNFDMRQGEGDRFMVQSIFENVLTIMKSVDVKVEVAVKLIAQHLSQNPDEIDERVCSKKSLLELHNLIPEKVRRKVTVKGNMQATFDNLMNHLNGEPDNVIYKIIHSKRFIPHYSAHAINELAFKRIKTSDLVRIDFSTTDPAITYYTLLFFSEAFIKKYRLVKVSETNDIVSYFEGQLRNTQTKLDDLESQLLSYRTNNNILDYTEQVRAIAQRRQEMEGDIYKERMNLSSSEYSSQFSRDQLDMHLDVLNKNTEIVFKRQELERLAGEIGIAKVFSDNPNTDSIKLLETKIAELRAEMESDLDAIFGVNYSTSGVKSKDLLNSWFENIVKVGESKAKLEIYSERKNNFIQLYRTLAPVGSNLVKIEREVKVAEAAYLKILSALNLAKMRQQNITLSTKLKVVDAPLFPSAPDPSKRKMLIIIGFLIGSFFIVSVLILLEFINRSIRQPLSFESLTGLKLASAYPFFSSLNRKVDSNKLDFILTQRLIESVQHKMAVVNNATNNTKFIVVTSMYDAEGKSFVSKKLAKQLINIGHKVALCLPDSGQSGDKLIQKSDLVDDMLEINYYNPEHHLSKRASLQSIAGFVDDVDYMVLELPPLQNYLTSHSVLKEIDICLLVSRANRSWTTSDSKTLENIKNISQNEPMLFLNGVKLHFLEEIIGKIPKVRSRIRIFFRKLIQLELKK
jgi:polysaccharide biosynthesis transport protein